MNPNVGRVIVVLALIVGIPILIIGIVSGGGNRTPAPSGHTVVGAFDLLMDDAETLGATCAGSGGYDDIHAGAQVKVTNQDGTLIGTGDLGSGERIEGRRCRFGFTVAGLPDAEFYSFELGRRGAITYSKADMEAAGWAVGLSLGG